MNKRSGIILFVAAFIMIIATSLLATESWVNITPGLNAQDSSVRLLSTSIESTCLSVDIPGVFQTTITSKHGEEFLKISIPGEGVLGRIGEPSLPVIRRMVQVPFGAEVQVFVEGARTRAIDLHDQPLWPHQPPVEKIPGARSSAPFVMNEATYSDDEFSEELAMIEDEGVIRGMRFVTLAVSPVRYNPLEGTLSVVTGFTVSIQTPAKPGASRTLYKEMELAQTAFRKMTDSLFLNGRGLHDQTKSLPVVPAVFLVITNSTYAGNADLQELLTQRSERGFDMAVATTNIIGSTKEDIKSYIQTAYDTWSNPPAFVLFVGDTDVIPCWTGSGDGSPATDLNYSLLDGSDYFADVFLGRLSVDNSTDLANIVGKTLSFENLDVSPYSWIQTATFLASTDNYSVSEGTHNSVISSYLDPAGYTSYKRYTVTYNATASQVTGDINGGLSQVTYSGHGSTTYWADGPAYYASDVNDLTNNVFPFVQSYACITGQFESGECFTETWIRATNGAVAAMGSSVNSYWDEDDVLERGVYEGFFNNPSGDNQTWLGGMMNYGKAAVYTTYGNTGTVRRYFEMYNMMGDSSVDLWNGATASLYPTYPGTIQCDDVSMTVDTGVEGAVAALSRNGGLKGAARSDASGVAEIVFISDILEGTHKLLITGHNLIPYEASITATCGTAYYCDEDSDNYFSEEVTGVGEVPPGCSTSAGTDCDDDNPDVNPGETEICNDIDDNCDGQINEGGVCSYDYYCDDDADNFISAAISGGANSPAEVPAGCVLTPGNDCDDTDPDVNPDATEVCNGIDDNCNTSIDEGGDALCNDGNGCTDDICDSSAGMCVNAPNSDACDDGLFCNGDDFCQGGSCSVHSGDPCGSNETCNEETMSCESGGLCGFGSESGSGVVALLILLGMFFIGAKSGLHTKQMM